MKTKLIALSLCSLALAACDMEQRPESAADRGGTELSRPAPGGPGAVPNGPMTPPANQGGPATQGSPATPPASGGTGASN